MGNQSLKYFFVTLTQNSSVVTNDTHTKGPWKYPFHQIIALQRYIHEQHDSKTNPVFLPADGEASWSLLPSLVSLLSGGTMQPEQTYSCILKVTGQV